MEKQNESVRERLLARLPQPESLAAYREETVALLAKHTRALRWDKIAANTFVYLAVLLFCFSIYPGRLGPQGVHSFQFGGALLYFVGTIYVVQYKIYESQVATLKEIKQVQLQILELQASLNKREGAQ